MRQDSSEGTRGEGAAASRVSPPEMFSQDLCQAQAGSTCVEFKLTTTLLYFDLLFRILPRLPAFTWEQTDKALWSLKEVSSGSVVATQRFKANSLLEASPCLPGCFPTSWEEGQKGNGGEHPSQNAKKWGETIF